MSPCGAAWSCCCAGTVTTSSAPLTTPSRPRALILRRRPDVALVDLSLPGESGAQLTRRLLEQESDLRIILYTGAADESELLDGLDAGAAGFALKSGDPEELEEAIRTVADGGDYLDPRLAPLIARSDVRPSQRALPARARDPRAAGRRPQRRGGGQAAVPLLRDRPHPRAQRHDQARRRHAGARRRARARPGRDRSTRTHRALRPAARRGACAAARSSSLRAARRASPGPARRRRTSSRARSSCRRSRGR